MRWLRCYSSNSVGRKCRGGEVLQSQNFLEGTDGGPNAEASSNLMQIKRRGSEFKPFRINKNVINQALEWEKNILVHSDERTCEV